MTARSKPSGSAGRDAFAGLVTNLQVEVDAALSRRARVAGARQSAAGRPARHPRVGAAAAYLGTQAVQRKAATWWLSMKAVLARLWRLKSVVARPPLKRGPVMLVAATLASAVAFAVATVWFSRTAHAHAAAAPAEARPAAVAASAAALVQDDTLSPGLVRTVVAPSTPASEAQPDLVARPNCTSARFALGLCDRADAAGLAAPAP